MPYSDKKIVIFSEDELKKVISRITFEIIEKVLDIEHLLLIGIPTRGVHLAEVLGEEIFNETGINVKRGIIDPTFYRDDQSRVGTRLVKATEIPTQ